MKLYLAGPYGFSEAGRHFLNTRLIPELERIGAQVLDPWKLTSAALIIKVSEMQAGEARRLAWSQLNTVIGRNNVDAIDTCDLMVAVLDGVDVDSGTAAEIGYAFAKGKPLIGYRGDFRLAADNEGGLVNLQVEYFIRASGGSIAGSLEALLEAVAAHFQSGAGP